jgi:citrate synthase
MVHEQFDLLRGFRATPTRWRSCAASSARCRPSITTATDIHDPQAARDLVDRLIAKMPTIAAMAYKYSVGQPFVYPQER